MMIHDVGQTFGRANRFNRSAVGSVNFATWAHTPMWKDATRCVANLPGSPKGAIESLDALLPVLRHALEQLAGGDHG